MIKLVTKGNALLLAIAVSGEIDGRIFLDVLKSVEVVPNKEKSKDRSSSSN